jgi:phage/plasmid-like protein (TIGR03299 family)
MPAQNVQRLAFCSGAKAEVKSPHDLLSVAGLNWEAKEHASYIVIGGQPFKVPDYKVLVRSDNGYILSIVGSKYGVIQPSALADLADDILKVSSDEGWSLGQAGYTDGGNRIWMQMLGPSRYVGGEKFNGALTGSNSYDRTRPYLMGFSNTIAVCANTLAMAISESKNQIEIRHTLNAVERLDEVRAALAAANEYNAKIDKSVLQLMNKKISDALIWTLAAKLFPAQDEAKPREGTKDKRVELINAYQHAPGNARNTAWGAVQAATYFATHRWGTAELRENTPEAIATRVDSSLWGPANKFAQTAWDTVLDDNFKPNDKVWRI